MALTMTWYRQFGKAADVLKRDEGAVMGCYFKWLDEHGLAGIYAKTGFSILATRGIGTVSGTGLTSSRLLCRHVS